jgi:hypothetical protein
MHFEIAICTKKIGAVIKEIRVQNIVPRTASYQINVPVFSKLLQAPIKSKAFIGECKKKPA